MKPHPDQSDAWKQLTSLAAQSIQRPLSSLIREESRFATFSYEAAGLLLDLSKQRLTTQILDALLELAAERGVESAREQLFAGGIVNVTQAQPALHTALRALPEQRPAAATEVAGTFARMSEFTEALRQARWRGVSGKVITDVVHIGIGGSHLGPQLVVRALTRNQLPRLHFVANMDAHALHGTLRDLDPEQTLFVIVSKSFETLETRINADSARSWFLERVNSTRAIAKHFLAVSANPDAAEAFGIPEENRFEMWDWVGGRFSLWSAAGLSIMLHLGVAGFAELRRGAQRMDSHFQTADSAVNLPVLMALTGIWNYNFLGVTNHAILPYAERLALLPGYLQQLMMESNGKRVRRDGTPVSHHTMPIVWGGTGTSGQHAFHQLLHQGTRAYTADFVLSGGDEYGRGEHQRWLLANALGQSQAMLRGEENENPHKAVPGNHATTTIVLPAITPFALGALLALYEHCVFCQGVIWDINSFDQWGVELGKRLAVPIHDQLGRGSALLQDAPTRGLIEFLRGLDPKQVSKRKS